jgi:hypothetical protein
VGYSATPVANHALYYINNVGTWVAVTGCAYFYFAPHRAKEFDISQYVKKITIDMGKSDVDGEFVEGQADFELDNRDGRFSPTKTDSPYYEFWDVNADVKAWVVHNSITYGLFQGFINRIRPDLLIDKRSVFVSCADWFSAFKENVVNYAPGATLPPHTLIGAILDRLGVPASRRNLDTSDNQTLANYTFTNEKGLDALALVVASGQHHQFVDRDGVYQFKTNIWLGNLEVPDYDWAELDVEDFKIEHDIKGVSNSFRVGNVTLGYTTRENVSSQTRYGKRDFELDNDLIRTANQAADVADNVMSRYSGRVNGCDITIKNRLPEVFDINPGTRINFTKLDQGLDDVPFVVQGLEYSINPAGDIELALRCKYYYEPPAYYNISTPTAPVGMGNYYLKSQRVLITKKQSIQRYGFKFSYVGFNGNESYTPRIRNDNAGVPGSVIALGNPVLLGLTGTGVTQVDASIGAGSIIPSPVFEVGQYIWFDLLINNLVLGETVTGWGTDPGDYADGYSAYANGPWVLQPTVDYWLFVKPIYLI